MQSKKPEEDTYVSRLEVIDETGRVYVRDHRTQGYMHLTFSYQDDGRTLKIFVRPSAKIKSAP